MKLSKLFHRSASEPLHFQQENADTFRSQKVSRKQFETFFDLLREANINPNASTRDRGITFSDPNTNAAFGDAEGKIVADISVIDQLRQKGLLEKAGITVTQKVAAPPASNSAPKSPGG